MLRCVICATRESLPYFLSHKQTQVKVVHHSTRRICANCWSQSNDFHAFYQSIEHAQNEYIARACIDDVDECTRLAPNAAAMAPPPSAANCNGSSSGGAHNSDDGDDDADDDNDHHHHTVDGGSSVSAGTAAAFKATIMQSDAVNLNRLNATILESDKALDNFDATNVNYVIPVCELPSNDDIVQNIIRDDVLHMEMHCVNVDGANSIGM